jgi:predicted 3-demethylubiquinone-9 3-methyltransferase (glyoxalase superfamily)
MKQRITPCLWFDTEAEEAARFYASIFKNSRITAITHYGEGMPMPKGTVMTVRFELDGQEFLALNGGPTFPFTEAISLMVECKDQKEIDFYWDRLLEGGSKAQCGWLKDKYGLSWQVVPQDLDKLLSDKDPAKSSRVLQAVMGMVKLDVSKLEAAYAGTSA